MATDGRPSPELFSSPSMRARAYQVRLLSLVDELERAWLRRDYFAALEATRKARELLPQVEAAWTEAETWADTITAATAEPEHPGVTLTGGDVPPHRPGAYPTLACCGGRLALVPNPADQAHPMTEAERRAEWGDR